MIAIPVKTNKMDTAVAPLFGKAKWFAIVDEKANIQFWHNEVQNGRHVVESFASMNIENVIFQDMGGNPYMQLSAAKIACYYAGEGRITLTSVLEAFQAEELIRVSTENMMTYVEKGHKHSKNEGHHHHEEHHHHHH